jgi:hypothetical protein
MGARLANEDSIKELSNGEVKGAEEVLLKSGLGTAGVANAIDMLIPRWLSLPDALVKISAEQVVAIVSSIHQSGVRSPNIQAVIRALCKHLVSKSSSFGSPLKTPELAVLIKILRGFDFEGDEILEAMCCLARWVEEQFGSAQRQQPHTIGWPSSSSSSPDRQISREQFCEMVLYVNQLPSTPEVLKTRDTLARRFSLYPEVIKDFSAEQRRALIDSYASIEPATSSIRSASEKLQQHNHHK